MSHIDKDDLIGKVFFSRYKLEQKIGEGSFGSIYIGVCDNTKYALKFESRSKGPNLLESEAQIMSYLKGRDYNILVMELLGKSLEDILKLLHNKKMSIRSVCNIGIQMITILQFVHDKHIIHRDIKPDNFVMGTGDKERYIYLLDFGLAKKYRSSTTLKHNPMTNKKKLTGTARYASINALNGLEQSRRDDLEAVGYVLMYFLKGSLPWQGLPVKHKEDRYLKIMEKKRETTPEELCEGFPKMFEDYVTYTRNLQYEEDPNYEYLKDLFVKALQLESYEFDYYYDWMKDSYRSVETVSIKKIKSIENENNIKEEINDNDIVYKKNDEYECKENDHVKVEDVNKEYVNEDDNRLYNQDKCYKCTQENTDQKETIKEGYNKEDVVKDNKQDIVNEYKEHVDEVKEQHVEKKNDVLVNNVNNNHIKVSEKDNNKSNRNTKKHGKHQTDNHCCNMF